MASFMKSHKKSSKSARTKLPSSQAAKCLQEIKLWASRVVGFSSQYNSTSWSANMALGAPRVYPKYGDLHGAWAQGVCGNRNQYLELGFAQKLFIEKINIYETYHGGSVRRIKVREQGTNWTTIWETDSVDVIRTARVFSPEFQISPAGDTYSMKHLWCLSEVLRVPDDPVPVVSFIQMYAYVKLSFHADEVRIETDCSRCGSWAEIDAVQIVGTVYYFIPPSQSCFAEDLNMLVNNSLFSDVQFQVGKRIFSAHKAILTARSDFFRAMFCDQMRESTTKEPIPLPGIDSDSFAVVLHFIYTNTIPSDCSCLQLVDVWRVADQYNLEELQAMVIHIISTKLNSKNIVDIYNEATTKLPEIADLKTMCSDFAFAKYNSNGSILQKKTSQSCDIL